MAKKPANSSGAKTGAKSPARGGSGSNRASAPSEGGLLGGAGRGAAPTEARPMHPAPIGLGSVLGQERAIGAIRSAIGSERIHHAWVFAGPVGVGKLTTALAFAAMVLDPTCERTLSGEFEVDPESQVQRLLKAGLHPDLHVVTKELARFHEEERVRTKKLRNIPIDVARDFMIAPAALAPSMRSGSKVSKVFIVDEAELLDSPAQNAMLKTLEEPPSGTMIILVTSAEEWLLPTVRSRCHRVGFAPLDEKAMRTWTRANAPDVAGDELEWLLSFSCGSPGVFNLARETGLHAWHTTLEPMLSKLDRGEYDVNLAPTMAKLVDEWAAAWVKSHANSSKESANFAATEWMLRLVSERARHRLRAAAQSGAAGALTAERLSLGMIVLHEAYGRADGNMNLLFVMEGLVADILGVGEGRLIPAG